MTPHPIVTMFHELTVAGVAMNDALLHVYEQGKRDATSGDVVPAPRAAPTVPPCPYDQMLEMYRRLKTCRQPRTLDAKLQKDLRAFWVWLFTAWKLDDDGNRSRRATTRQEALDWIDKKYLPLCEGDDWLMGKIPRTGEHAGWVPHISYVYSPECLKNLLNHKQKRKPQ
jgi:hypothetical protein